jgi:hypothetical protein
MAGAAGLETILVVTPDHAATRNRMPPQSLRKSAEKTDAPHHAAICGFFVMHCHAAGRKAYFKFAAGAVLRYSSCLTHVESGLVEGFDCLLASLSSRADWCLRRRIRCTTEDASARDRPGGIHYPTMDAGEWAAFFHYSMLITDS